MKASEGWWLKGTVLTKQLGPVANSRRKRGLSESTERFADQAELRFIREELGF